jgi:hypothetical protein
VVSDKLHNGCLPTDCNIDPCTEDHLLSLTLFISEVINELYDHFLHSVHHIVKCTFGHGLLNHRAVENLISNRERFSNANRLYLSTPILLHTLRFKISSDFLFDCLI